MSSLIIGHKGQIGSILKNKYPDASLFQDRIENKNKVDEFFAKNNNQICDYVYLTAALTNVDLCEEDHYKSYSSNVQGVKNVTDAVKKANSFLYFFSSDYVFDGIMGNYTVNAAPNPINRYGIHKLCAENYIMSTLSKANYKIIRTNMVYGHDPSGRNFSSRLLNNVGCGKELQAPIDEWVTPTYNEDLVYKMVTYPGNLCHLAGDTIINRYAFAYKLIEMAGLDTNLIKPIKSSMLNRKANRPLNGGLISSIPCGNLYDGMQKTIEKYNES